MKNHLRLLSILFIAAVVLAGCNLSGQQVETEALPPISAANWPTPLPATPWASPTPFPKITLAPTATHTARPTAVTGSNQAESTVTPTDQTRPDDGEPASVITTPVMTAEILSSANLEPITTALVKPSALNMRQGPGAAYGVLGTLLANDPLTVLAFNQPKDWVLVKTAAGQEGWVYLEYLAVEGSLAHAPVVTPDSGQAAPVATGNVGQPAPVITDLSPIATARIGRLEVDLRPGPSTDYAAFNTLTQDDETISILGLDTSKNWALVDPAYSDPGWMALSDLQITAGSIANAPLVVTGWVESNEVEVRRGPGIYHDLVGRLSINSLVRILGLNEPGRSWALIKPITGGGLGWSPVRFLDMGEPLVSLPAAPVLNNEGENQPLSGGNLPILQPSNPHPHLVIQLASGGDIMVINPDGAGLRRLTTGIDPVLSPDGQTIAFTRWQGESGSVWLINLDGSNERQIFGFTKQAKGPDWSPDGSQIVLNFQHEGRLHSKTTCYDLSEGDPPRPPANAYGYLDDNGKPKVNIDIKGRGEVDVDFCWKVPPDPHWSLRRINLADGSFTDLDGGTYAFRPAWDPSQPWRIISDGGMGLVEADVNQKTSHRLTDEVGDSSPVFSPDGRYLAVTAGQQGGSAGYDIFRLNADGSGRVRLTQTPLWVSALPDENKRWNNVAPAWSPDGCQIAFLSDRTGRWEVWVMNADGSNQRPMFSDEVNAQLQLTYNFVDERVLSWR
jgi:uncharacterized protein YraI